VSELLTPDGLDAALRPGRITWSALHFRHTSASDSAIVSATLPLFQYPTCESGFQRVKMEPTSTGRSSVTAAR